MHTPDNSRSDTALRRLVYQVLWPGFNGTTVPDWLARALQEGLGGALYFAQNFDDTDLGQPARLSQRIHSIASRALLGVDEEVGIVTRLEVAGGSSEPGNAVLGRVDNVDATLASGERIGRLAAIAGIDIDLAPVVDVNSDARNPVIGVRSFGSDPRLVARHAAAMVTGIQHAGVAACVKHFPGYGDVVIDPHLSLPTVHRTPEQFRSIHMLPFQSAIHAGTKCVMVAHIAIPAMGTEVSTINPNTIDILRRELGFDGVVICDALDMGAIRDTVGQRRGGVLALLAGNDLLCIGNPVGHRDEDDFIRVSEGLFDAVDDGSLPVSVLEHAGARISRLAEWRLAHRQDHQGFMPTQSLDEPERLARKALEVHGDVRLAADSQPVLLIDVRSVRSQVVGTVANRFLRAFKDFGIDVKLSKEEYHDPDPLIRQIVDYRGEVVLIVGQLLPLGEEAGFAERAIAARSGAIVLQTGWPADDHIVARRLVRTYGDSLPCAKAAVGVLSGN